MSEVKKGNLREMAMLFEKYHVALYNFFVHMGIRKDICQDLTQNLFYRMIKYRNSFRETNNFRSWMYRIARNICMDYMNEQKVNENLVTLTEHYSEDIHEDDHGYTENEFNALENSIM